MTDTEGPHEKFGTALTEFLDARGWHAVPRRELTVAMLHFAGQAGVINLEQSRYTLATKLKISPSTLDGLLRDRALFFEDIAPMAYEQFAGWIRRNNQTSEDDAAKGRIIISVATLKERMQAEQFLDSLGVVPDYKNNHRLLVLDLTRLLSALSAKAGTSPAELLLALEDDQKKQKQRLQKAKGSEKKLVQQALEALKEQADKHLGEKTVEFALRLFQETGKRCA